MLNACLRVLASERERKTKHRTIIQNIQKQGPRSSMDFPARADPRGLQKDWLGQIYARSSTLALERKASLHGSPLERQLPPLDITNTWISTHNSMICTCMWNIHYILNLIGEEVIKYMDLNKKFNMDHTHCAQNLEIHSNFLHACIYWL